MRNSPGEKMPCQSSKCSPYKRHISAIHFPSIKMQDYYIYAEKRSDKGTTALSLASYVELILSEREWTASELSLLIYGRMVQQLIQPELVSVLKDVSSLQILSLPTIVPGNRATPAHFSKNAAEGGCELPRSTLVGDTSPGPHSQSS